MKIVEPSISIEDDVDGEKMLQAIERAGRTCWKSEANITPDSSRAFVKKIIANGHESVLEHEKVTTRIICDRGVSHELVRHRIASYSQESTRYCDYAKAEEIQVIEPPGMSAAQRSWWLSAMIQCEIAYNGMRRDKASPQIARSVLPNSLKTEVVMTANLREWRHFFKLRAAPAAHPQMRQIAHMLLAEFRRLIPVVFDEFVCA